VLPDILRPVAGQLFEALSISGVQGARRLLEAGKIAGNRPHELTRSFPGDAGRILTVSSLATFIDESAFRTPWPVLEPS
jgi:hypothetical protein